MFKLIAVTLAAMFTILHVFGDPERRPVVAREASDGLTLAAFVKTPSTTETQVADKPLRISKTEAIQIALEAGKAHRLARGETPRTFASMALAKSIETKAATVAAPSYWLVSGSRVNIRRGPGTNNAVVGQVTAGMEAEVLDARNGWMQIITKDGATSGWISGQFLEEQLPG